MIIGSDRAGREVRNATKTVDRSLRDPLTTPFATPNTSSIALLKNQNVWSKVESETWMSVSRSCILIQSDQMASAFQIRFSAPVAFFVKITRAALENGRFLEWQSPPLCLHLSSCLELRGPNEHFEEGNQ